MRWAGYDALNVSQPGLERRMVYVCVHTGITNIPAGSVCAQPLAVEVVKLPCCPSRWSRMKLSSQASLPSLPGHVLCVPFQDGSGNRMDLLNSLDGLSPLREIQGSPQTYTSLAAG